MAKVDEQIRLMEQGVFLLPKLMPFWLILYSLMSPSWIIETFHHRSFMGASFCLMIAIVCLAGYALRNAPMAIRLTALLTTIEGYFVGILMSLLILCLFPTIYLIAACLVLIPASKLGMMVSPFDCAFYIWSASIALMGTAHNALRLVILPTLWQGKFKSSLEDERLISPSREKSEYTGTRCFWLKKESLDVRPHPQPQSQPLPKTVEGPGP